MTPTLHVDVHAFGSRNGYRMLAASEGVSTKERHSLDPMASGVAEVGPSAEVASTTTAMLVRTLPGGRIALTRWFTGAQDDAGRPTVALRTLIFEANDWATQGRFEARGLLGDHDVWDSAAFGTGDQVTLSPSGAPHPAANQGVFRLADLIQPGAMPLRLIDDGGMRDALIGLVERMHPEEVVHLQWGIGLSHIARGLDIMTLTRGGLIASLDHAWHREDLKHATGPSVPRLTAPAAVGLEQPNTPQPAPAPATSKATAPAPWKPARRRKSVAPFAAAALAVVVIALVLWWSQGNSDPAKLDSSSVAQAVQAPEAQQDEHEANADSLDTQRDAAGFGRPTNTLVGGATLDPSNGARPSASQSEPEESPSVDPSTPESGTPSATPQETATDSPDEPHIPDEGQAPGPTSGDGQPSEDADASGDDGAPAPGGEADEQPVEPAVLPDGGATEADPVIVEVDVPPVAEVSALHDPRGVRMRVEAIEPRLIGFSPGRLLGDMGQVTDAWSFALEPDEATLVLRDTFCERLRDRADLTRWENELLDPSLLGVRWGLAPFEHWIRDNTLGDEDSDRKNEVLDTARADIRSLDELILSVEVVLRIEKALARNDKGAKLYPSLKALPWLTKFASGSLPRGHEAMTVELFRTWHADAKRRRQLERVGDAFVASRKRLGQWLEATDPYGKHP